MTFAWPHLLWLMVVPAGLLAWELARRRAAADSGRPKILRAEAGLRSLTFGSAPGGTRPRSRTLLCAGLALAVAALARPQWGRVEEPAFAEAREIVIALDLSRSMLTPDIKPSRLERAKLLVESLLDRLRGERVGLVIFSGTAFLQSPLSADYEVMREFLPVLGPDYMPEGGTNYGAMIDAAAGAFGEGGAADRYLIVLSDGGATDEDWRSHIGRLKDAGVRVIGLGIGTAEGALIPDGSGGFIKDDRGAVVKSGLDSGTLRELAAKTGGAYRDAGDWVDLPGLLRSTVETGRKGQFLERNTVRRVDRFQWLLAPGLLFLLASYWLEFPVRPKPREIKLAADGADRRPAREARAAGAVLILLALAAATTGRAQGDDQDNQAPPDAAPLTRIVGRLADADRRTAHDWKELSEETIDWGQRTLEARQSVPPGPVRDGLAAVDAGAALDARAADWPRLRSQLQALLQTPPQRKPPPKPQQNRQRQQREQQSHPQGGSGQREQQKQASPQQQPSSQNALGPMNQSPPTPQQAGTQKVGGAPQHSKGDPVRSDPELEASLEKLDQLKNQDSPAELYQMIERNEPRKPQKPAKDW